MTISRQEHPRPQMVREGWQNLNGEWDFEFDLSRSGLEQEFQTKGKFTKRINVPFCPESKLSGIGFVDFIPACWYRKTITITPQQKEGAILLHFGAVDYKCTVFINGIKTDSHKGGYSSFHFDISGLVQAGENTIVVCAEDDTRSLMQPTGKQSILFYSRHCHYTRTTGIWQTVWLEFAPKNRIASYKVIPDLNNTSADFAIKLAGDTDAMTIKINATFEGRDMGSTTARVNGNIANLRLALNESHPWDVGVGNLYDITIELIEDSTIDKVTGYFGLRNVYLKDHAIYLNNRPVYQRLVLDQGFYPDGIYTAPTDEALINDIKISMDIGFNGARLHERAFEERFLYHADRLGYLVWGEHANWGLDTSEPMALHAFLPEWLELVERDFNHPSIVGWCPFNETWDINRRKQVDDTLLVTYLATKAADPTRPVIDTSGNFHVITDIYDIHDYDQDVDSFSKKYKSLKKGEAYETHPHRQSYSGQPYFVSEYGGTWWAKESTEGWGYGKNPDSIDEFVHRYVGLTNALISSEGICAFCYTQLYDVEQEQNGLYDYNRNPKFEPEVYDAIRRINTKKAAIEM